MANGPELETRGSLTSSQLTRYGRLSGSFLTVRKTADQQSDVDGVAFDILDGFLVCVPVQRAGAIMLWIQPLQ